MSDIKEIDVVADTVARGALYGVCLCRAGKPKGFYWTDKCGFYPYDACRGNYPYGHEEGWRMSLWLELSPASSRSQRFLMTYSI